MNLRLRSSLKIYNIYTPQNNLRTTKCKFPYVIYFVGSVAQTRHDIEKRFSVPLMGVKNKAFPIKYLAFKILAFSASQICNFSQIFKKIMFYHFKTCLPSAMSIVHNDIFIFYNFISISLKVPSITIVFSMGS